MAKRNGKRATMKVPVKGTTARRSGKYWFGVVFAVVMALALLVPLLAPLLGHQGGIGF